MVVVIDEWEAFEGLVMVEDVIEEISATSVIKSIWKNPTPQSNASRTVATQLTGAFLCYSE